MKRLPDALVLLRSRRSILVNVTSQWISDFMYSSTRLMSPVIGRDSMCLPTTLGPEPLLAALTAVPLWKEDTVLSPAGRKVNDHFHESVC